ncbi:MAG: hypothetical protein ABI723_22900 [Bacteroidia bacterium]
MEEQIWNYIDGTCTEEEKIQFEKLLASNADIKKKYEELLQLNQLFAAAELNEPSMRFTMNVMDAINAAVPVTPLKTFVDQRIIKSIAIFFVGTISVLLIYLLSQMQWSFSSGNNFNFNFDFDTSKIFSTTFINVFVMINVILGLLLLDKYLHWKKFEKRISH